VSCHQGPQLSATTGWDRAKEALPNGHGMEIDREWHHHQPLAFEQALRSAHMKCTGDQKNSWGRY